MNAPLDYWTAAPFFGVLPLIFQAQLQAYALCLNHGSFLNILQVSMLSSYSFCSWAYLSFLTPLVSPYFSCKAQLKKHILYVVSHEYWFITRYINFSLISAHITSILSPLVWQLSVHILSSPTGLWSSENRDLSMFIFLFKAFSTVSSLAHWTSSDVCYLKESKWINKR